MELTNKCNIQCDGCGQRDEVKRPDDALSIEEYIDIAKQAASLPLFAASITGGETLMFLDRIQVLLNAISGVIDIYKINTNGYRFVTKDRARTIFQDLKKSGFGLQNRYIKSVFVISIGQQSNAGIPIENAVNAASVFYDVFSKHEAILAINVTDKSIQTARRWSNIFRQKYEEGTGMIHDDRQIPIREFMLNTITTLRRLQLDLDTTATIPDLFTKFKQTYTSWKCLNTPTATDNDMTTLMPKMVLRPNGDVMACPGYGYVHKIGNTKQHSLFEIIQSANTNPVIRIMYTDGLPGLFKQVKQTHPEIAKKKFSISHDPCDICKILTDVYNTTI